MKKVFRIIKLIGVFLGWCASDIRENFQDIQTRYKFETDEELNKLMREIEDGI